MEQKRLLKRLDTSVVKLPPSTGIPSIDKPSSGASKEVPDVATMNPLITDNAVDYLNYRIQQEEYSSRIYMSMTMWLDEKGFKGAAALWRKYSDEELTHADIARKYLLSFGVQPLTPRLDQPQQDFSGSLPEIVRLSYEHEIEVSTQIKKMADFAMSNKDHILYELCLGYLKEQVEEHDKMQTWMDKLRTFGTDPLALRLLDNDMAEVAG
jgi:ferritin